jgi:hypothetical protein
LTQSKIDANNFDAIDTSPFFSLTTSSHSDEKLVITQL